MLTLLVPGVGMGGGAVQLDGRNAVPTDAGAGGIRSTIAAAGAGGSRGTVAAAGAGSGRI